MKRIKYEKDKCLKGFKKALTLALSAAMAVSLAACGGSDGKDAVTESSSVEQKEFVYVPEYISMEGFENANFYDMKMVGNSLYYSVYHEDEESGEYRSDIREYSLETKEEKVIPLSAVENRDRNNWILDKTGNFYSVEYFWEPEGEEAIRFLCKYDKQGNMIYEQDITEILNSDENNSWISSITVDEQGRLYAVSESLIHLFDAAGEYCGSVELSNGWINAVGLDKEGRVYICCYDYNSSDGGMVLTEIDFDGKKLGKTYSNVPNGNGREILSVGVEKDFLINDSNKVYEYDMATQSYEEILDWLDSDINGTYVDYVGAMEDGRLLAVIRDWNTDKTEIACLTKKASAELPQKTQLVIGTLYSSQAMQAAAVDFNKSNSDYRVTIKAYMDTNNWTDSSWEDAITALNNDILSKTACPDILDLSNLNIQQLASKGVLEDLTPYLDKSVLLNKEDFLESIIDGYTLEGKLVTIPDSFQLSTLVGKASDLGTEMGWTVEEMVAYANEHSEASLFEGITKLGMLSSVLRYNQSAFIDWESGKCSFDSDEFKQLLGFANTFPQEYDWEADDRSTPLKIQSGDVLLDYVNVYELNSIQEYEAMFNEPVTMIGYPNSEGESGCYFTGTEMYGIASKSGNKEGAWAFLEACLSDGPDGMFSFGLPTNKKNLEELIAKETEVNYLLDEEGNPLLDENGEPIPEGGTSSIGYGDWEYTYHIPTEAEISTIRELIAAATPAFAADETILTIIQEETEAYFKGQKSVDEVAAVIQSRVQLYVNENQ